jgi:hypothetical protein
VAGFTPVTLPKQTGELTKLRPKSYSGKGKKLLKIPRVKLGGSAVKKLEYQCHCVVKFQCHPGYLF